MNDGRETFFEGEQVHDLPNHPILGITVDSAARGYARFYDPTPGAIGAFMKVPGSAHELREQVELHESVDLLTHVTYASIMTVLSAADRIQLLYLGGLAAFTAAQGPPAVPALLAIAALAAAIVANARLVPRSSPGRFVHDYFPVATVITLFNLTGFGMAGAERRSWDVTLARLARALFGDLPAAWLALLGRPASSSTRRSAC